MARKLFVYLSVLLVAMFVLVTAGCNEGGSDEDAKAKHSKSAADFCGEHQIAEAQCPYCNP
ncbi:MAG: hypothetical protein ABIF77_09040, partial [bacterium]